MFRTVSEIRARIGRCFIAENASAPVPEAFARSESSIWERRLLGYPVPGPPTTLLSPACTSPEPAPPASDLPTRLTARAKPPLTQWAPPTGSSAPAPYPHLLAPFSGAPVDPLSGAPGPGRPVPAHPGKKKEKTQSVTGYITALEPPLRREPAALVR